MRSSQFEFISGSLCLDFVDTLANRCAAPIERLVTPGDLDRWFEAAGLVGPVRKKSTPANLADARSLRDAIFRLGLTAIENEPIASAVADTINHWAIQMPLRPTIAGSHIVLTARQPIEAALSTIAANAIELVLGRQRSRIRVCPECRMVFVDTSRPGKRRWCSSASGCGNRAKVRAHRSRRSASP
jgi:predicted RNA-binding Zn ribbon-like protein